MLVGVAAVLPVISEITAGEGQAIAPGWATVALAAAALLIGFDRFFGFSSGWMRFMVADLTVKQLRHDFEYAWQAARVREREVPSDDEVVALLELARKLAAEIDAAITEETGAWVTEFRSVLESAGKSLERSDTA